MHEQTLLFVGPPSSGKGTQSELVAQELAMPRIDVGALLRERARTDDATAHTIQTVMEAGKTLDDDTIRPIAEPAFITAAAGGRGLIIDGYCRTVEQVDHITDLVRAHQLPPLTVIHITVNEAEATLRMQHRRYCSGCNAQQYLVTNTDDAVACVRCGGHLVRRNDDSVEVFTKRIATFNTVTKPAIAYLSKKFPVITINGEHSIAVVHSMIMHALHDGAH